MSSVLTPSLRRDLGLVFWQIRYEQRAYWRNRGRGSAPFAPRSSGRIATICSCCRMTNPPRNSAAKARNARWPSR